MLGRTTDTAAGAVEYSWNPAPALFPVARAVEWLFFYISDVDLRERREKHLRNDTISLLKVRNVRTDFNDLSSHISPENRGPILDEDAVVLDLPVYGVDRNGVVLDENLVGTWGGVLGFGDLV